MSLKGRFHFTKRWLDYMHSINFPFKILIADGDASQEVKELVNLDIYNTLEIEYFQFEQKKNYADYYLMMHEGMKKIKTRYVMICDNDDFILMNGFIRILKYLRSHPDAVSRGGYINGFTLNNGMDNHSGTKFNLFKISNGHLRSSEPGNNIISYIDDCLSKHQSSHYNVNKTEVALKLSEEMAELNLSSLRLAERYQQLRLPSFGEVTYDSSAFYYLRQKGTSLSSGYNPIKSIMTNSLSNDIELISNKISHVYEVVFDIKYSEVYAQLEESFLKDLTLDISSHTMKYRFSELYNFKLRFLSSKISFPYRNLKSRLQHQNCLKINKRASSKLIFEQFKHDLEAAKQHLLIKK